MNSLKKALACLFALAIIFVASSCSNASSSSDSGNGGSGSGVGQVVDGLGFDLSNAKSFFAGKASSSTASRAIDDNSVILMKITDDGTIEPAMDFKGDNIYFNLNKILKNPSTKELFLLGNFSKSSWDENGKNTGWDYNLIRVAQNGNWYGLPNFQNIQTTQEPFDSEGNFYFQRTDYSSSTQQSNIYKYSGGTATAIVNKANLQRVLPNGAIIYSVENQGITYNSYYYIRLRDGKVKKLDDYSTSVYVKDKNIFYYSIEYVHGGENNYYVDDAGNEYKTYEGSYSGVTTYYANKGGKKIYVTEDGDSWKDENGKTYDSHVFSGWENFYWNYDDVGNKIYLTHVDGYYEDKDGNRYDSYDKYESGVGYYYVLKDGKKIEVEQFLDDSDDWRWKDSEGNTYDTYAGYESGKYYVFKDGKKIELERFDSYYKDSDGNICYNCDNSEGKTVWYIYEGGELVEVEYKNGSYKDADGNEYSDNEVYSVYDNNTYYYVTINGKEVPVKPAQTYSTDVIVAKYYDFIANTTAEAVAEVNFSGDKIYNYNFDTSSENVFGTTFITNYLWKFEIQDDFSLKCKYNLSEKGYSVATSWDSNYNFIGENSNRYLEKFLYNGDKIYFLGTKGSSWSQDSTYNLYKIIRFGDPQEVLSSSDASNYTFNGNITFSDDGNFIGSVLRKSDGKWGTLSGSMEYGTYEFKEDSIFESVKDIVINFD